VGSRDPGESGCLQDFSRDRSSQARYRASSQNVRCRQSAWMLVPSIRFPVVGITTPRQACNRVCSLESVRWSVVEADSSILAKSQGSRCNHRC
jgi:hypothetical protein